MPEKTEVFYDTWDPNEEGVIYVAIQAQSSRPYVFATYNEEQREEAIKIEGSGMMVVPIVAAKNLFEFKKDNLESIASD